MARRPSPWYWKERDGWYVTVAGARHRLAKGRRGKEEALRAFHRLMLEEAPGPRPRDLSFALVADLFYEHACRESKPGTAEQYRIKLQSAVLSFGRVKAADLKPSHVSKWLARQEWSDGTRRGAIGAVKAALNHAVREGYLAASPLAHLARPAMPARTKILSDRERTLVLGRCDEAFRDFVQALSETGCRVGEVCALAAADIRWEEGIAEIARKGRRERVVPVYLTPAMLALCRRLARKNPEGPIFRNARGRPWTTNAVRCRFRRIREQTGVEVTSHCYRRSYITAGLERGVPIATMAELAGHSDIKTTMAHYNQLSQRREHLREQAEKAAGKG
jgi:integrase